MGLIPWNTVSVFIRNMVGAQYGTESHEMLLLSTIILDPDVKVKAKTEKISWI